MTSSIRKPGLAEISLEWTEFAKQVQVPPLLGDSMELRQMKFPQDDSPPVGFSIKQIPVPGYQGWTNQAQIYTPDAQPTTTAVIIYVHGGGWTVGDLDTEDAVCRTMCKSSGVVVVSLDYRKTPENSIPIGLKDVWAGVLWVFDNIEFLGGNPAKSSILAPGEPTSATVRKTNSSVGTTAVLAAESISLIDKNASNV